MNLTLEAIFAIWILLIFSLPIVYLDQQYQNENYILLNYFYNKIGKNESLSHCLIKENCNMSFLKSYNCTSLKKGIDIQDLPKKAISFYLFGYYGLHCPTLVIIDLDKAKDVLLEKTN